MEVCPYSYLQWCDYFWGPWVLFVITDEFSMRVTKNYFKNWCLLNSQPTFLFLTQWIIAILSKGCKPDKFEPHNSLNLSSANIRGLHSNFVEWESLLDSNSPVILALCKINLDDLIDFGNFSVRSYLPLIRKDSITHMHGLAVYMKEGLPFAWGLSLENSADSY